MHVLRSYMKYIRWFGQQGSSDVSLVGGKNASLGRMIGALKEQGVRVPDGFAITVDAYWQVLDENDIRAHITALLASIKADDVATLQKAGAAIRAAIEAATLPDALQEQIVHAYDALSEQYGQPALSVAVRSSATAEDLPSASFAGQQESYLHIKGHAALLSTVKKCMASLFTDRAMSYRMQKGFDHMKVGLSVGVQKMVNAGNAASGVAFSLDTDSGFADVVMINGTWGLAEALVKGSVIPDEYLVFKPLLKKGYQPIIKKMLGKKTTKLAYDARAEKVGITAVAEHKQDAFCLDDEQILALARAVCVIEDYYSAQEGRWAPQDVEWAIDADDRQLYIVQSRPETVFAQQAPATRYATYSLDTDKELKPLVQGMSIGQQIVSGNARVIASIQEMQEVQGGDIIVTQMTDPDWVPVMKKAAGIITNQGGRTCHAAIVCRELGIPALVGTTNATELIKDGQTITLDCARGQVGAVYAGDIPFKKTDIDTAHLAKPPVELLVNCADPSRAFSLSRLPVDGVGLARLEFILSNDIGVHPLALCFPERIEDAIVRKEIECKAAPYGSLEGFFVQRLAQAIGMIAAAFYPRKVIVRCSDFKTNEYRNLLGGSYFEQHEENPMLGWRGASRYYDSRFVEAFALECAALRAVRETMGFANVQIMVPFVRTLDEAQKVSQALQQHGLERGKQDLRLLMMCEVPSNVLLIEPFSAFFDGFSIGSNDLTQCMLGIDRDQERLAYLFDENDPAMRMAYQMAIEGAHAKGRQIGICGQGPSDEPDLAHFLIATGIDSISLSADAIIPFLLNN